MKPKHLMIMGFVLGLILFMGSVAFNDSAIVLISWAAGALFGKGYGVQEEREWKGRL